MEPRVIVADWRQTQAALQTARRESRAVFLCSPQGASSYLGAGFWRALQDKADAEYADVSFTLALDCADRAGDAMAALRAGVRHLIFSGRQDVTAKLRDMAGQLGAAILS
jgi:hypothetical protein